MAENLVFESIWAPWTGFPFFHRKYILYSPLPRRKCHWNDQQSSNVDGPTSGLELSKTNDWRSSGGIVWELFRLQVYLLWSRDYNANTTWVVFFCQSTWIWTQIYPYVWRFNLWVHMSSLDRVLFLPQEIAIVFSSPEKKMSLKPPTAIKCRSPPPFPLGLVFSKTRDRRSSGRIVRGVFRFLVH